MVILYFRQMVTCTYTVLAAPLTPLVVGVSRCCREAEEGKVYTMTEADFTKKFNPNNYGEDAGHVGTLSGCGSHEVSSCLCERFEPV